MKVRTILAITALLAISGAVADERDSKSSVAWDSLSEQQQQVLSPFVVDWGGMRAERQQWLARGADRCLGMSPDERDGAHMRFAHWQQLPDGRRDRIRTQYQRYRDLTPDERRHVRDNFRRFQQLPADRRQELRRRFREMTPEQRQRARERMRQHQADRPKRDN